MLLYQMKGVEMANARLHSVQPVRRSREGAMFNMSVCEYLKVLAQTYVVQSMFFELVLSIINTVMQ